jgi:hypothetical protein
MSFSSIAQGANQTIGDSRDYLDSKTQATVEIKNAPGIKGWVFDITNEESIELRSDITDHFTESNSYINDHIVNQPEKVTLSGLVGELVYEPPRGLEAAAAALENKLEIVEAFAGDLTPGAVQAAQGAVGAVESAVSQANQVLDRAQNVLTQFSGDDQTPTRQAKAIGELFALWKSKQLVTVQTPWKFYTNMIIESIRVTQGETISETDVSVSLKELRFTKLGELIDFSGELIPDLRADAQAQAEQDSGKLAGKERTESFISAAFGGE